MLSYLRRIPSLLRRTIPALQQSLALTLVLSMILTMPGVTAWADRTNANGQGKGVSPSASLNFVANNPPNKNYSPIVSNPQAGTELVQLLQGLAGMASKISSMFDKPSIISGDM